MKNLFTIVIIFSNRKVIVEQREEKNASEALVHFMRHSDVLDGYDREGIEGSLSPLHHNSTERGVWTFSSKNENFGIISGTVIQTDKGAYLRPHHH